MIFVPALNALSDERDLKPLNSTVAVSSSFEEASVTRDEWDAFANECQWRKEGKAGHFGDSPHSAAFNTDPVDELSRLGRLRMVRLLAENQIVAYQYAFAFGDCCSRRLPARAREKELDQFGLGVLGIVELFEAMIKECVRRVEAGVRRFAYEIRFSGLAPPERRHWQTWVRFRL
jgi:hypothetical protein